jgi:WD40 repeat protein
MTMKDGMSARVGLRLGCFVAGIVAVSLGYSRPALAYDAAPTAELRPQTFDTGLYSVQRVTFSHDGRLVAFLGYAASTSLQALEATVFDVRSRRLVKALSVPNSSGPIKGGIAFSPDDTRLAAGAHEITIWDVRTWTEAVHAPGPFADGPYGGDDLIGMGYSPDGRHIVAAYGRVWGPGEVRVGDREEFVRLSEAVRAAYASGRAPDVYERPEIEVLDASTGARLKRFAIVHGGARGDRSLITSGLVVSQDGKAAYVAVRDYEGLVTRAGFHTPPRIMVERVDLESGQVSTVFGRQQEDEFTALAVNADQTLFATGEAVGNKEGWRNPDGTGGSHETVDPVGIWSTQDGVAHEDFGPPSGAVRQLQFQPDGPRVITCQTDGRSHNLMTVWDIQAKRLAAVVHLETPRPAVVSCALSSDGRQAVLTVPTGGAFGSLSRDTAYLVVTAITAR